VAKNNNNKPHLRPSFNATLPPRGPRVDAPVDDVKDTRPSWRIGQMDMEGPWGWGGVGPGEIRQILDRLRSFESMKWGEIENTPSCGLMDVSVTCTDAKRRLEEIRLDDVDVLFKLRVGKRERVWGVRTAHVFEVLWWDPDHTVYPMNVTDN
jgi:hypothetical protein